MIKARGVSKAFGPIKVLQGIDVDIPRREVTAIVGPNASGKTTFNKIVLGLVRPTPCLLGTSSHVIPSV